LRLKGGNRTGADADEKEEKRDFRSASGGDDAEWRLASLHSGVPFDEARKQTGFPLVPEKVPVTFSLSP
jgi:hypothetical protein